MKKVIALLVVLFCCRVQAGEKPPIFSLAWSEYPSWAAFQVADELGILNGQPGELGEVEKKYNVDISLKVADYDTTILWYGTQEVDSVCITNVDVLKPSMSVPSVAVFPTSTSSGADALIAVGNITTLNDLKGRPVYGLSASVSEYLFVRYIEKQGGKLSDFRFENKDPGVASTEMQQGNPGTEAIVVWNPFLLQTLAQRKESKVIFNSTAIPKEIIDMVVFSVTALNKPGSDRAVMCLLEAFYKVNERLNNSATRDDTLLALGANFAKLSLAKMREAVRQTSFYGTSQEGLSVFSDPEFPQRMAVTVKTCTDISIIPPGKTPVIKFGSGGKDVPNLRFETRFLEAYKN